jgi:hypothetical protein
VGLGYVESLRMGMMRREKEQKLPIKSLGITFIMTCPFMKKLELGYRFLSRP